MIAPVDELAVELRALGPFEFIEAAVERFLVIAAVALGLDVEHLHGRQPIGHILFADQVAPAELDAIDAEIGRHHIEQPLTAEIGLEAARPAISPRRRLVGHDQRHIDAHVRDAIRPGHDLRNVARRGGAVGAHIGAEIGEGAAAQGEDRAIALAGNFQVAFHVARMIERAEVLAPILGPFDRTPQKPRRKRNEKILGIKFAARAEPAADVVFHHAHRFFRQSHHLRQRAPIGERHLADAFHRDALLLGIPLGQEPARLHRHRGVPLHAEMFAPRVWRVRECRVGVAAHGSDRVGQIGPDRLEENDVVLAGFIAIGNGRQRLDIDDDGL